MFIFEKKKPMYDTQIAVNLTKCSNTTHWRIGI